MTQHIQVVSPTLVVPNIAKIWRDDQTLMWGLDGNLAWPADEPHPIQFLPGGGGFEDWRGSSPSPIGDPPPSGQPDQRYYVALGQQNTGSAVVLYHYKLIVVDSTGTKYNVQFFQEDSGEWHDPDVANEPKP